MSRGRHAWRGALQVLPGFPRRLFVGAHGRDADHRHGAQLPRDELHFHAQFPGNRFAWSGKSTGLTPALAMHMRPWADLLRSTRLKNNITVTGQVLRTRFDVLPALPAFGRNTVRRAGYRVTMRSRSCRPERPANDVRHGLNDLKKTIVDFVMDLGACMLDRLPDGIERCAEKLSARAIRQASLKRGSLVPGQEFAGSSAG